MRFGGSFPDLGPRDHPSTVGLRRRGQRVDRRQNPTIFRKVVRASGQIVATPSGNLTIVCHGQVQAPSIVVGGAPSAAIVVKDGPCFFGKRQVARSQLVVTPSLNVTFVCHDKTAQ